MSHATALDPHRYRERPPSPAVILPEHIPPAAGEAEGVVLARLLRDHWRLMAGCFSAIFMAAVLVAVLAPSVYQASMLIYVEEGSAPPGRNALGDAAAMFDTKKAASAEMELLRSRAVLGATVERLRMAIDARPEHVPLLAALLRRLRPGQLSTPGLFGYGGMVWGDESIDVSQFDVPGAWFGRRLRLTALGGGTYTVADGLSGWSARGRVGELLQADTPQGPLALLVDHVSAQPGAWFALRRVSTMVATSMLQRELKIAEQGRQSGVIEVRFESGDPETAHAILREISQQYMGQNARHRSEEAENTLAFLDTQLPKLKASLEKAENAYNSFRHENGTVDFAEEARQDLMQAAAARTRRSELVQRRTELLTRFTSNHPMVIGVNGQISDIDRQLTETTAHIKALPLLEQEAARLSREVKVNTELYTALANTAQQLRVVSVGKASNVRLVDAPVVEDVPIRPQRRLVIIVGAIVGLIVGVLAVLVRKHFGSGVDDPLLVEQLLGARVVHASIPHSDGQSRLARLARRRRGGARLLAVDEPADGAIEALRSFRASLRFSMPEFRNNVIMFAGPTSGLGKSFVSANFAAVLAASGQRVLLIDADLRNGCLHQAFGVARGHGLCEAASGAISPDEAVQQQVVPNLDLITTGSLASPQSGQSLQVNLGPVLDSLRARYDMVLIDSPPVLAVADPLVIGRHAGAVFLVLRAGVSTTRDIAESVKCLHHAGIAPAGVIFNDVKARLSYYGNNQKKVQPYFFLA